MEEIILAAFGVITKTNGPWGFVISLIILGVGALLFFKKTNIQEITSVGTIQHQQIEGLMQQVTLLSEELSKARKQLSDIHEQNVVLMQQVRDSNKRIQELEDKLNSRKTERNPFSGL